MSSAPRLRAEGLTVRFRDADGNPLAVIDGADFEPRPGTLTVVIGASGSGKSTLLNLLAGLVRPDAGRILFDAVDISALGESKRDRWRRDTVGMVFQDFHLIDELGPLDNVVVAGWFDRFTAGTLKSRAASLLDRLGVPASRKDLAGLSRGERQRLAVARALMFDPPVVLADEPTASLDRAAGRGVADLLAEAAHRDGRTVVVATHDRDLIDAADRVHELSRGRLASREVAA